MEIAPGYTSSRPSIEVSKADGQKITIPADETDIANCISLANSESGGAASPCMYVDSDKPELVVLYLGSKPLESQTEYSVVIPPNVLRDTAHILPYAGTPQSSDSNGNCPQPEYKFTTWDNTPPKVSDGRDGGRLGGYTTPGASDGRDGGRLARCTTPDASDGGEGGSVM